jgi:hypothetical protein
MKDFKIETVHDREEETTITTVIGDGVGVRVSAYYDEYGNPMIDVHELFGGHKMRRLALLYVGGRQMTISDFKPETVTAQNASDTVARMHDIPGLLGMRK